jgi:type II secretory pathway predicted ATPase ExeA
MYYEHFGLLDDPFKFVPSNALFPSAAHREGLATLEWGLREPSGLTLLVGEVGTGKTMLIHALLARQHDRVRIAQLSDPTLPFEEMLRLIVSQLGIHPAGRSKLAILQSLKTFLADPTNTDSLVLMFDEAQGLSDEILEELRLLSNSRPPHRPTLQIILVGQHELVQRLTDHKLRALNQRIGARALLRPLRGPEIRDYVNYLLRAQDARREVFSPRALDRVAVSSGGLPRKINNLCHNSLMLAYSDASVLVKPRHVEAASVEIENLLNAPGDYQAIKAGRGAIHRMIRGSKHLMAGGFSALILVAIALALFGTSGLGTWFAHVESAARDRGSVAKDRELDADASSKLLSGCPSQSYAESHNEVGPAASLRSWQSVIAVDAQPAQTPVAQSPQPISPKARPGTTGGMQDAHPTRFPSETTKTLESTNSSSLGRIVAPPDTGKKLTFAEERMLSYDVRRAQASLRAARYSNAVYHLKRAIVLEPGNPELRELLQRALDGQSEP